ncbi:predicted protein [Phaeodactylum tricornutum CCAP 1055/1]|uniref:Methyltransferase domain-containing protein n=3 Tax=Phaeodactylum tricornutum TaxID=2850 RepID=B7G890_PHATC|nr:predicted protein [Phaeodactylum tricornutum CCAP 1055/1]EEC45129.1 predicted protein [Phaeodactylum tricornutum CCAP 1055/1]|eukprot:XP_002183429.1 predicted protein [Phaeodactylum tricornutum CCAP 1055/1]
MSVDNRIDADAPTQEWDVDRYQGQHSFVWKLGSSLLELIQVSDGQRILDVGCGSGELTQALSHLAKNLVVTGMDADPDMVAKARQQFPSCDFFQGDMRNFEVPEPVDVLFSNAALHWIPAKDAGRAVACMAKALRPGGQLVVEFGGKGNVERVVQSTLQVLQLPASTTPWNFPSISEYTTLLEENGMEVSAATLFDRPVVLKDGEAGLSNWLRMFGSTFFKGQSDEEIDSILVQINDLLRSELFNGTDWTVDYRRIRIVAKKL